MEKKKLSRIILKILGHTIGFFAVYILLDRYLTDPKPWLYVLLSAVIYGVIVRPLFDYLMNKQKI